MRNLTSQSNRLVKESSAKRGLTLIEVMTIVITLGLLAMMVLPKFTKAKEDDREAVLAGHLQTLRCQMELYKVQHEGEYPFGDASAPVSPKEFVKRMTSVTDAEHQPGGIFGPYFSEFPTNPYNESNAIRYGRDRGANQAGWCVDVANGTVYADDNAAASNGELLHTNL